MISMLSIPRRQAEVIPRSASPSCRLDDEQRDSFAAHLDRVGVAELVWCEPAAHTGRRAALRNWTRTPADEHGRLRFDLSIGLTADRLAAELGRNQQRPCRCRWSILAALFWSVGWSMARLDIGATRIRAWQVRIATTVRLPANDRCPGFIVE